MSPSDLVLVAGIVAGFGVAVLAFRLSRETAMGEKGELTWVPWADRLVIGASLISLLAVIAPILVFGPANLDCLLIARSATLLSVILLAGYIPAILAHYRLLYGHSRGDAPRENPEPAECAVVLTTAIAGAVAFFARLLFLP